MLRLSIGLLSTNLPLFFRTHSDRAEKNRSPIGREFQLKISRDAISTKSFSFTETRLRKENAANDPTTSAVTEDCCFHRVAPSLSRRMRPLPVVHRSVREH